MESSIIPIELIVKSKGSSRTLRTEQGWTLAKLLTEAGLSSSTQIVLSCRSIWEHYRELDARSSLDRSSARLVEENRRLAEEVLRLENLLQHQKPASTSTVEPEGPPNSARSRVSRRSSVGSMISYQSEVYMEHQEGEILRLDDELKALKEKADRLALLAVKVRLELDKANSVNEELQQKTLELLAEREMLLRRASSGSSSGSPDSSAGMGERSPEYSVSARSLLDALSPSPASPSGLMESSSLIWYSTPAVERLGAYSPGTTGKDQKGGHEDVVHMLTVKVAELERDKAELKEQLSRAVGEMPNTSRPSCSPSSAGRSFGASLCDELTAFQNAEKVEELEAETEVLRDTVARYRTLVQRKVSLALDRYAIWSDGVVDEFLARIIAVLQDGHADRKPLKPSLHLSTSGQTSSV
ncbi:hypothetical protein FOL47_003014 [Perkinsus chesapeaki]|uniref:Uncharacterized protein n=1 Tax=Perkinsus chesapeaki TaxID=330153 RepID=A0A7J6MZX4_PERCH|nr:hypothetical protein FOL47_003014 [Perkinsus chesapeaki]